MDGPTPYFEGKGRSVRCPERNPKDEINRFVSEESKQKVVQLLLNGHSAPPAPERWGHDGPIALYRWTREALCQARPAARTLRERVNQLEEELRRVEL